MFNRVVSFASLMLVVASLAFFVTSLWAVMSDRMDVGSGIFALTGWVLSAIVFAYRWSDPQWLDPVSIIKSR